MSDSRAPGLTKRPSVFLSYAGPDRATAQLLALRLQDAGVDVWWDELVRPGMSWRIELEKQIQASDYIIVLVSSASDGSIFFGGDQQSSSFLKELRDRSISIIPIRIDDVEMPSDLSGTLYLDLRTDPRSAIDRLVSQLRSNANIDYSRLNGREFESLVGDLLVELGFRNIQFGAHVARYHIDFLASYPTNDPFGRNEDEAWVIETKHHASFRLGVQEIESLRAIAFDLAHEGKKLAVITTGLLTSAARQRAQFAPIRLIEGLELKRLLLTRPALVERHFGSRG